MTLGQFFGRIAFAGIAVVGIFIAALFIIDAGQEDEFANTPEVTATDESDDASVEAVFDDIFNDTIFEGTFVANGPFSVAGEVSISGGVRGERILTISDDFRTSRGPELLVFLRAENGDFIDLGPLQAIEGGSTYVIPGPIDMSIFTEVQIWDDQNSTAFASAFIAPAS